MVTPAQDRRCPTNHCQLRLTNSAISFQNVARTPVAISQIRLASRAWRGFPTIPKDLIHVLERHDLRYQSVQPRDDPIRIEGAIAGPRRQLRDPDAFIGPRTVQLLDKSQCCVGVLVIEVHRDDRNLRHTSVAGVAERGQPVRIGIRKGGRQVGGSGMGGGEKGL